MNQKMIEAIVYTAIVYTAICLFIIALISVLFIVKGNPIDNEMKYYCYKLQDQAEDYQNFLFSKANPTGFYVTKDDMQMCLDLGIIIKAPVK